MHRSSLRRAVPVLSLLVGAAASAQTLEPHQRVTNSVSAQTTGGFGTHVIHAGDVDGDGFDDYAVAAPNALFQEFLGRVYVHSGRTSLLLHEIAGDQVGAEFGTAMAFVGDATGDGVPDIAIGSKNHDGGGPNRGRVALYDTANGSLVWEAFGDPDFGGNLGESVHAIGDLNGDGVLELAVGEPRYAKAFLGQGRICFYDGATGLELGHGEGTVVFGDLGRHMTTRPGSNLVYAALMSGEIQVIGLPLAGVAKVSKFLDGIGGTGNPANLILIDREGPGSAFDLVLGRFFHDVPGAVNGGRIEVVDLGSGLSKLTIDGTFLAQGVGMDLALGRDVDGDGEEEIFYSQAGAGGFFAPAEFRVVRQDGTPVLGIDWGGANTRVLSSIGDTTGDGRGEALIGVSAGVALLFEAAVFSQGLELASSTSDPSGFSATWDVDASPLNAGKLAVQLYASSGAAPGFLLPGAPLLPLNLDDTLLPFFQLIGTSVLPDALGALDAAGRRTTTLSVDAPTAALLSGVELTTAVVVLGAGGIDCITNPARLLFP